MVDPDKIEVTQMWPKHEKEQLQLNCLKRS